MLREYQPLINLINESFKHRSHLILGIDGRSGAGKSTLASLLAQFYASDVIHMDEFFLPADLRTPKRLSEPGGNIHYERFSSQILSNLQLLKQDPDSFRPFSYEVFDCHTMKYKESMPVVTGAPLTVIEGSYSLHPRFRDIYDLKIFLDITPELQKERLLSRVGKEACKIFESKWIPMEEFYFRTCSPASVCDFSFCSK